MLTLIDSLLQEAITGVGPRRNQDIWRDTGYIDNLASFEPEPDQCFKNAGFGKPGTGMTIRIPVQTGIQPDFQVSCDI